MKVVTLRESNFRDAAATLRVIAEEIDAGKHGEVGLAALALRTSNDAEGVEIFAAGPASEPENTALLFYKAFQKMMEMF